MKAGVLGTVKEVHVWTNRPYGYWPQGVPRPAQLEVEDRTKVRWDNNGVNRRIADAFLDLTRPGDSPVEQRFRDYLEQQDDPRLTEIFARLQEIYLAHPGGN